MAISSNGPRPLYIDAILRFVEAGDAPATTSPASRCALRLRSRGDRSATG